VAGTTANNQLGVSVIIATRNRAAELRVTLESLRHQSFEADSYEVVVVANGCSDDTASVLGDLATKMNLVPEYLDHAGKSAALNRGMQLAGGQLLVFTDDDVLFSQSWLAEFSRASHTYRDAAGFCGPITPLYPKETPLWIRQHPFRVPGFAEVSLPASEPQPCPWYLLPFGPNFAVRAERARGLLFRTDLGASDANGPISCEDSDFASRFREMAGPIWFLPDALVGHRVRSEQITVPWMLERAFTLGRSLIAQRIPETSCHPPAWYVNWHPAYWNDFDHNLIINFILGQLSQCERRQVECNHIAAEIRQLLPKIVPRNFSASLSKSAEIFVISETCEALNYLL